MDRLKQIESFVGVATKGSLTATAQAEGVAPAVIGRRIDALEERLGVKLLVRTTRRITLTHEGSAFLEDCQRLLAVLIVIFWSLCVLQATFAVLLDPDQVVCM